MLRNARFSLALALTSFSVSPIFCQNVISAKSGLVHYVEGDVKLDGQALSDKAGAFASMKVKSELDSQEGRAEVLLTPGVFLRVGENSAVRMVDDRLSDTRIEVISGQAMVESDTPMKGNAVTVVYKDYTIAMVKHGLYGIETAPAQLKVYSGEALVTYNGGQTATVKEGRLLPFSPALVTERFNSKEGDSLYRWSKQRSEYLSIANLSAAKSAQGSRYSGYSFMDTFGGWFFDPFYSMYTYVPFRGTYFSPFGFAYFSPFTVNSFYYPGYYSYGNYGGGGGGGSVRRSPSTASIQAATVAAGARMPSSSGMSSGLGSVAAPRGGSAPAAPGGHR